MNNKGTIFHHISVAKTSLNLAGGEKAEIEIVDFLDKKGFKNIIYTSESGEILYKRLKNFDNVNFVKIGSFKCEKINPYLAYYLRFPQLFFRLRKFNKNYDHIIFTHDDFIPSTLYSFLLKLINPKTRWYFIYHMKCPGLFRGYLGEFTNKFYLPNLRLIRYWLGQRISFLLTRKIDKVITNTSYNLEHLLKFYPGNKIYVLSHFGGTDSNLDLNKFANSKKEYDVIYMGRFHPQKGIFDLLKIADDLRKRIPNIKIVVIGGGDGKSENKFLARIKNLKLERNVFYKGYISGSKKYTYLAKSKIFLLPSYYESFGIVILEAMSCGLPIVVYDLPVFRVFEKGIVKINISDSREMSNGILKLLSSKENYKKISKEALEFSNKFSWEKVGEEIYNLTQR